MRTSDLLRHVTVNPSSNKPRGRSRPRPEFKNRFTGFPSNLAVCRGRIVVDALVFEFLGLAMLGLCIVVLAVPARRPPARHISDY